MRIRKKKWAAAELADNPNILKSQQELTAYVAERRPIHLEVGCGKGRFICEAARRNPDIHYVAVERDPTIMAAAARLSHDIEGSLAFFHGDVRELASLFASGDIARLYINFCDPWPRRKKWAKRRLTHVDFLAIYESLAIPEIHFKTDNRILFESSIEYFSIRKWLMQNVALDLHAIDFPDNIVTEYEDKFSKHGPIYRLEAINPNLHKL